MKGKINRTLVVAITLFSVLLTFSRPTCGLTEGSLTSEIKDVKAPQEPELKWSVYDPKVTALLVRKDIEKRFCNSERRGV